MWVTASAQALDVVHSPTVSLKLLLRLECSCKAPAPHVADPLEVLDATEDAPDPQLVQEFHRSANWHHELEHRESQSLEDPS